MNECVVWNESKLKMWECLMVMARDVCEAALVTAVSLTMPSSVVPVEEQNPPRYTHTQRASGYKLHGTLGDLGW